MTYNANGDTASQQGWKDHAYPLQLITIELQGTRHSTGRNAVLAKKGRSVPRAR